MVKKSLLGRIFGKKNAESRSLKKKSDSPAGSTTATATLPPKGKPPLPGDRGAGGGNDKQLKEQGGVLTKEPPKDKSDKQASGKQDEAVLEPEILTRTERVATESRDKIDVITRKMSSQEEASIKISEGIKGLSGVLSNIDERLQEQTQQSCEIAKTVKTIPDMIKDLPESSRAGIELLHSISKILETQSTATFELGNKIADLPNVLNNLSERIDKDAENRTQERNAIKDTFGVMKNSIDRLDERNRALSKSQLDNTKKIVDSVKHIQTEHKDQIRALIDKSRVTNRLILILGLLIIAGLITVAAVLQYG